MESRFRTVLLMFCLVGLFQARPFNPKDLGFKLLLSDVSCNDTVTFQSPANVQTPCHHAALRAIMDGLEHAKKHCTDICERLDQTLETLDGVKLPTQVNQTSDCKWEKKPFKQFVEHFQTFTELVNSQ